jgi:DNA topoisomerase VI subunit B
MLRTFMANPGLGGFGEKEAATPDAFCQIVKELVDNAVDACCSSGVVDGRVIAGGAAATLAASAAAINRRVRVVIEEYKQQQGGDQLLRVTVSDNGCGMESIQDCVGAFHSSKQGSQGANKEGSATTKTNNSSLSSSTKKGRNPKPKAKTASSQMTVQPPASSVVETHTAGRYGIGLTLCLLHAQRLVPDSCASIQSATRHHLDWTVVQAVVETDLDTIRCLPSPRLPKSASHESGTSIGVLLPVRLSRYFAYQNPFDGSTFLFYYRAGRVRLKPGRAWPNTWHASSCPWASRAVWKFSLRR